MSNFTLYQGDVYAVLPQLPDSSVDCIVTSPPYFNQRDYGHKGQIGLGMSIAEYVEAMRSVFAECRRVLKPSGTLWLNLGDSYAGSGRGPEGGISKGKDFRHTEKQAKPNRELPRKNLIGIPWRVAFALQDDGWILRSDIIWHKPAPMPESVKDRPTKSHEYVFMFSKSERYYYGYDDVKESAKRTGDKQTFGGAKARNGTIEPDDPRSRNGTEQWGRDYVTSEYRNMRTVWTISTEGYSGAHHAVMPIELAATCIKAGCPPDGVVFDPFMGSGTTAIAAARNSRDVVGIELVAAYAQIAIERFEADMPLLNHAKVVKQVADSATL